MGQKWDQIGTEIGIELGPKLDQSRKWDEVGPNWNQMGQKLGKNWDQRETKVGPKLNQSGTKVGPNYYKMGQKWDLWTKLDQMETKWDPIGSNLTRRPKLTGNCHQRLLFETQ